MEKMENENQESSPDDLQAQAKPQTHIIINPYPSQTIKPMDLKVATFLRLKILTVALGTIIMGVGGNAFFESAWNKQFQHGAEEYLFDIECIFVSITLIVYMLSIGNLVFTFDTDYKVGTNVWEKVFHIMAGIFLLIGGGMNLFSAQVILHGYAREIRLRSTASSQDANTEILVFDRNINQFYDAKIAAGFLSFVNAILYFVTSRFVPKANA